MAIKYLVCAQCGIIRFLVKNSAGESIVVQVTREFEVIPVNPGENLDGFDLTFFYCLGCSWKGNIHKLKKYL